MFSVVELEGACYHVNTGGIKRENIVDGGLSVTGPIPETPYIKYANGSPILPERGNQAIVFGVALRCIPEQLHHSLAPLMNHLTLIGPFEIFNPPFEGVCSLGTRHHLSIDIGVTTIAACDIETGDGVSVWRENARTVHGRIKKIRVWLRHEGLLRHHTA